MSEANDKPVRDEQTLARVLEAAYVMQEHNRKQQKRQPLPPTAEQLAEQIQREERAIARNMASQPDAPAQPPRALTNAATMPDPFARPSVQRFSVPSIAAVQKVNCSKCGHELLGQELFCGNCGFPRNSKYEAPRVPVTPPAMQARELAFQNTPSPHYEGAPAIDLAASLISAAADAEAAAQVIEPYAAARAAHSDSADLSEADSAALDFETAERSDLEVHFQSASTEDASVEDTREAEPGPETPGMQPERALTWRSAASTREFLEQVAAAKDPGTWARLWNAHRGDLYLAASVVLVLIVMIWGVRTHSVSATTNPTASAAQHRAAADADLPLFDRILVKLGLAELPETPVSKGNPRAKVWEDLHSAQYYCPGDDLYGKTPKGMYTTQRDAQLDQFEPAYRKACN